ncbi:hypothetical protein BN14_04842 [Rhizoctonia solani AG-1 IB]|uniref:SPT2 domain-containing protein n=1 Tax=Thanatephorus cucumeris (strain AG1-IB / isolate 7/3/14) TaxID=1108050 RepID=M5BW61_THACB|nr:hypothetical protein BN14_04842 [Rhizoctonia solani AG-1 IB]
MLAGKPAASASRARTTGGGENSRPRASTSGGSGYDSFANGAMGLTREEKRARQNASWDDPASRSKYAAKKRKAGALLPGGALNVEAGSGSPASGGSMSVRARLAASQSGLIKLNTQKRDPRSIDEITRDLREKCAEEARERESKAREKEREKEKERERERERERGKDRSRSGSVQASSQQPKRSAPTPTAPPKPAPIVIATKPSTLLSGGTKSSSAPKEYKVTVKTTGNPPASQAVPTPTSAAPPRPRPVAAPAATSKPSHSLPAKRRRSYDSESDSYDSEEDDRERRRRAARKAPSAGARGAGFDIWSIINPGKSRTEYLSRDVVSDDEDDMEATGRDLEREEKQSARIAKQEDAEAEAEERRREEAKRRKKMAARSN